MDTQKIVNTFLTLAPTIFHCLTIASYFQVALFLKIVEQIAEQRTDSVKVLAEEVLRPNKMTMLLSSYQMWSWNEHAKAFAVHMWTVYITHSTGEKVNISLIYVFYYQISLVLLKSVNIALHLFRIVATPPISPASSQLIVTKLYTISI